MYYIVIPMYAYIYIYTHSVLVVDAREDIVERVDDRDDLLRRAGANARLIGTITITMYNQHSYIYIYIHIDIR